MNFEDQLRAIIPRARIILSGLSVDQINWKPPAGGWSLGECLGHLNVINAKNLDVIEPAVEKAKAEGVQPKGEPTPSFIERQFARFLEPPYKLKFKATAAVSPIEDVYVQDEILARWISTHARILDIARSASEVDLAKVKVPSVVAPQLRFSVAGMLAIIAAHDRRHLWQAEQIRAQIPGIASPAAR